MLIMLLDVCRVLLLPQFRLGMEPNAGHEPLPEAGAQRTLKAVGSMPWFGAVGVMRPAVCQTPALPSRCHTVGLIFGLSRKKLAGSYLCFRATSRS
jgi:hypothetical protein